MASMIGSKRPADGAESAAKRPRGADRAVVESVLAGSLSDPCLDKALKGLNLSLETKMRMLMPGEFTGTIIGKAGATIKSIIAKSGCEVQVAKEEETPDTRRMIKLKGTLQAISLAQQICSDMINHADPSSYGLEVLIPSSCAGIVIGAGGATCRQITADSGAVISIKPLVAGQVDRTVVIKGDKMAVVRAQVMIAHKIEEARAESPGKYDLVEGTVFPQHSSAPAFGAAQANPAMSEGPKATATMNVRNAEVGAIIGRGGSAIKQLMQITGTMIHFSESDPNSEYRTVTITGASVGISHAQHLVQAAITQNQSSSSSTPADTTGHVDVSLKVTNEQASSIIGRGGYIVKHLQQTTGTKIHFSEYAANTEGRVLSITGLPAAVEHAKSLIEEALTSPDTSKFAGGKLAMGAGESTIEMKIAQSEIGGVIGRGGENIKGIQAATKTRMKISEYDPASSSQRTLSITGSIQAVSHAQQMVEAALAQQGGYGAAAPSQNYAAGGMGNMAMGMNAGMGGQQFGGMGGYDMMNQGQFGQQQQGFQQSYQQPQMQNNFMGF